jgi:thiopurine S-methyltransferase
VHPEFWLERWTSGQIGFHQARVSPDLERHWPDLKCAPGTRVFVPLCGKSLDLLWLRDRGHPVVGVELSDLALQAFCAENGIPARRRGTPNFDVYEARDLELFSGDFFQITPALLGNSGVVYDRAALISWSEPLRGAYARHLTDLTPAAAVMLLITLEYPQEQVAGPPFSIPSDEVHRLYSEHFTVQQLSRRDILPHEPRMRARGLTELHEACYRLTRR